MQCRLEMQVLHAKLRAQHGLACMLLHAGRVRTLASQAYLNLTGTVRVTGEWLDHTYQPEVGC